MKIQIETGSYNYRRYSKPYIAKMDFDESKGIPSWGEWCGQPGDDGLLIIDADAGDILMQGQKDYRGNNGAPEFFVVLADGTMETLDCKAEAYKRWQANRAAPAETNPLADYTDDQLQAEIARRAGTIGSKCTLSEIGI